MEKKMPKEEKEGYEKGTGEETDGHRAEERGQRKEISVLKRLKGKKMLVFAFNFAVERHCLSKRRDFCDVWPSATFQF